jgi:hypothetical protein
MRRLIKFLAGADPARAILLAPAIFALHFLEEAPRFVSWFNSLVQQGISQPLFLRVNAVCLLLTVALATVASVNQSRGALLFALAWLGFLMFANAIFHIVGTVVHARYSPGVVTAVILYLPYFGWLVWLLHKRFGIPVYATLAVCAVTGLPMFIHGYLIVFEGRRLF